MGADPRDAAGGPSVRAVELEQPTVLLVEDDEGDAVLVEELVADGAPGVRMTWVRTIAQACESLAESVPDCVLLDLNLPDAHGLEALDGMREYTDRVAVVVLTGLDQERTGLAAVAAGAQDYLVKGRVEPELFGRALRYAIQRKQAERAAAALRVSQMHAQENARLERGLLPTPLLRGARVVDIVSRYRPGRAQALLGGDFYDVVQQADGTVHVIIGDVSGHGPDEAATGVALRLAWRTLVLSEITGTRQLRLLEEVLIAERTGQRTFATVTSLVLSPDRRSVRVIRAGHPGMLMRSATGVDWVEVPGGPALGFVPGRATWPEHDVPMPEGTGLMLFTDGLFEGHTGPGVERLGEEGLLELARRATATDPDAFVDELIESAEAMAAERGGLADDIAVLHLQWTPPLPQDDR
ncbi:PP2C family protein-serine/threonine phosphatase [Nocardia jejuensis]|uniref:PP2C family protein-serine/threonine phosphatase n=1 Tax=Nocardia jejuensis TaxID=328049 RepID=UPI00083674FE|nr:SpoIIE family protein phosphatase [Nocardia jejuensis]